MPVVVVESPAKAKTINKYLGNSYTVLASYGHVRDLPPKDGSVHVDDNFSMDWEVAADSKKHLKAITDALKTDPTLILATDPDREGEAISWHLHETLKTHKTLAPLTVSRVVFNAITKNTITEAMKSPRQIDMDLVNAYLARRALDYLVGFNLSPVLWRKLPGAKSAGRVQSVSLRLIVQREMEIEKFDAREYWSVDVDCTTPNGQNFTAHLHELAGKKLGKYDLNNAESAEAAAKIVRAGDFAVRDLTTKPVSRNPAPPFMTSSLQQDASRKFGFGAAQTMRVAQRLYESGHITYMRTDGIDMAADALHSMRDTIGKTFGAAYLSEKPRYYKNKAKNAQEAHECIRPTDFTKQAKDLSRLDGDQMRVYDLIYKRAIASQMASARLESTSADLAPSDGGAVLRASGIVVKFDGFLKIYEESRGVSHNKDMGKDTDEDKDARALPPLDMNDKIATQNITSNQHFTQPPPRYSEASLIKRMEELGIGRPSTYASIVTTIQTRGYVLKEKNRLKPEDKGRLVTVFLEGYFPRYVEYDFTASLEDELDEVSAGNEDYKALLTRFWTSFSAAIGDTAELRITDVLEKINELLAPHIFPANEDGSDSRICKTCGNGRLSLRTARSGEAFIGCSNYPECRYTRNFGGTETEGADNEDVTLGEDAGDTIFLRHGRFGPYVQRGEVTEELPKPPRCSIPKPMLAGIDLARALQLLALPRALGDHPEGGNLAASIGPYGPYVMWQKKTADGKNGAKVYANIKDVEEVLVIGMNRAVELISEKIAGGFGNKQTSNALKDLGAHPDGNPMLVMSGRYGPYVKCGKINATLPKDIEPTDLTVEQAIELVDARAAKGPRVKKAVKRTIKKTTKNVIKKRKPAAKKK